MKRILALSLVVLATLSLSIATSSRASPVAFFNPLLSPAGVRDWIAAGGDVNHREPLGVTPLMKAASWTFNPHVVKELIAAGAYVNAMDYDKGWTPLMYSARFNGNINVINALIAAGADVSMRDTDGYTALMHGAGANANREMIEALIAAGSDVNTRCRKGDTPLIRAATFEDNLEVIKALISAGAYVNANATRSQRWTALMYAVHNRDLEVVKVLIKAGADVNTSAEIGSTPLMVAVGNDDLEIVKALIEAGADVNAGSIGRGLTPLMRAAESTEKPEMVIMLLNAGADGRTTLWGMTAFDYARKNKNLVGTDAYLMLDAARF